MYRCLEEFNAYDLHPVLYSLANIFMYAQIQGDNEIMKFYKEGLFNSLLKKVRDLNVHSLSHSFTDLILKMLTDIEFSNTLFGEKCDEVVCMNVLKLLSEMTQHKCKDECQKLASENWPFVLHEYEAWYQTYLQSTYQILAIILRMNFCNDKLLQLQVPQQALSTLIYICSQLYSVDKKRQSTKEFDKMLQAVIDFIQHVIIEYKELEVCQQILKAELLQPFADLSANSMASVELQKKAGALLLQVVLNFSQKPEEDQSMMEKINSILYVMTNSDLEDLKILALWAIKINFQRYQNNEYVRNLYLRCRVIENVIPKIIDPNPQIQEKALIALANLVQDLELRNALINLNIIPRFMQICQESYEKLKEKQYEFVLACGEIICSLILENPLLQTNLINNYNTLNFCLDILISIKGLDDENETICKMQDIYSKCIRRFVEYDENMETFIKIQKPPTYQNSIHFIINYFHQQCLDIQSNCNANLTQCLHLICIKRYQEFCKQNGLKSICQLFMFIQQIYDENEYLTDGMASVHLHIVKMIEKIINNIVQQKLSYKETRSQLNDFCEMGALNALLFFEESNIKEARNITNQLLNLLLEYVKEDKES